MEQASWRGNFPVIRAKNYVLFPRNLEIYPPGDLVPYTSGNLLNFWDSEGRLDHQILSLYLLPLTVITFEKVEDSNRIIQKKFKLINFKRLLIGRYYL